MPDESRPKPRCPRCGGDLRFSHRQYRGGGQSVDVRRCVACGETVTSSTPPARPEQRRASKRAPIDEGPPQNTVLDPETAARILRRSE